MRFPQDDHNRDHQEDCSQESPEENPRATVAFAVAKPMSDQPDGQHAPQAARAVEHVGHGGLVIDGDGRNEHDRLDREARGAGEQRDGGVL